MVVRETVAELKQEVDQLELRNLHLLEDMQKEQLQELEITMYVSECMQCLPSSNATCISE